DSRTRASLFRRHVELAHELECLIALCDFLHCELPQPLEAEGLYAKTRKHASVDHRSAQIVEVNGLHCPGEISGHATGERVPCPGRIVNVFQRVSATTEELIVFAKKQRAVLAFLNCNVLRPHLSDAAAGLDETGLLCYFARFAVVEDEQINASKQGVEIRSRRFNPEIHCVRDHKAGSFHLVEHMRLQ